MDAGANNLHHIQRFDAARNHCWKVVVRQRGKTMCKWFTDFGYRGKAEALAAAIAYRDKFVPSVLGADDGLWKRNIIRRDNKSGIVGVARYIRRDRRASDHVSDHPVWQAFWHDADGKPHSRQFSIVKFGEVRAKALACAARREATRELKQELKARRLSDRAECRPAGVVSPASTIAQLGHEKSGPDLGSV